MSDMYHWIAWNYRLEKEFLHGKWLNVNKQVAPHESIKMH
jgi:hypothetical protein